MSWSPEQHERGLAAFLVPTARTRFLETLDRLRTLAHLRTLDPRWVTELGTRDDRILAALRDAGAPEVAYLLSEDELLDRRFVPLDEAVARITGADDATLVSCIPGRVGLFSDEAPASSLLLTRP